MMFHFISSHFFFTPCCTPQRRQSLPQNMFDCNYSVKPIDMIAEIKCRFSGAMMHFDWHLVQSLAVS